MRISTSQQNTFHTVGGLFLCIASLLCLAGCPFSPPTAAFSASPTEGDAPLTVSFTDDAIEGGGPITTWLWDFGDGAQSVEENPNHTYTTHGFYRVSLRVSNAFGTATETKDAFVNVHATPTAAFSASPRQGNTPLTVQFEDESIAAPFTVTDWRWTFGDGEVSTEASPAHTYEQPGEYNVSLTVTSDGGTNTTTLNGFIVVAALPEVTFDIKPAMGPAPLPVQFTDTTRAGSAPILSWLWDFGDGGTSAEQNPAHQYNAPGIYSVSLTVQTEVGRITGTSNNAVTVTQAPVAAFSATPTTGGAPLVVRFTDKSTPGTSPITAWLWDFGDGTSSVQRNPIHEFLSAGVFDVSLTVSSAAGTNTVKKTEFVNAQAKPTAAFTASLVQGMAPLTVEFTDTSTAGASPITGRQWNFGDSTISGDVKPLHVYTAPGIYTVSLLVQSAVGSNILVKPAFIKVIAAPTANFTATPTVGEAPLNVTFIDTSLPGTSPITTWLWDFGDGTTSDAQRPTRLYGQAGNYTVKLTVTTDQGANTKTLQNFIRVQQLAKADFTADKTTGPAPLAVQFRDASIPGSATITGRTWDFGDGTTSTIENPFHTYTEPGTYTVTLNLTTSTGPASAQKSGFIVADPAVAFTAVADSNRAPAFVTFTDTTDTGALTVTARTWNFGDGTTSNAANPIHQYASPGNYNVGLTLTTAQGDATLVKAGAVKLRPTPAFSGEPRSGAGGPLAVQFEDLTDAGALTINGWDWNFGDGQHSTAQSPLHSFSKPGLYAVSLTVLTDLGNSITVKDGYISIRPKAAFSADVTTGVDSLAVQFTDQTDPGNLTIRSWRWTFGDGSESTVQSPAHTYTQPGTYTVALTTTSSEGDDTATKTGYIKVAPLVAFSANTTSGEAPLEVTFTDNTDPGTLEITARSWDLGVGDPVAEDSPTFTYDTPGRYDVTLTVTTSQGDAFTTETDFIDVLPPLSATTVVTAGSGSASVIFTNTTALGNLTGATWLWDFGDGSTSPDESPTHNFTTPGIFDVMLTVMTAEGVTATKSVATISIDPIPAFAADTVIGAAPLAVQFTDTSNIGNLTVTAWAWDFGDSGTGSTQNPLHTYTAPGTYTATLTITTALGDTAAADTIEINVLPAPVFSADLQAGPGILDVVFTDSTAAGVTPVTGRTWNFGDGTSMMVAAPTATVSHQFSNTGSSDLVRQVTLTQHTALGDVMSASTVDITIHPIAFSGNTTNQPHDLNVTFTDSSNVGDITITSRDWVFKDGATATTAGNSTSHNYTAAGSYAVELTITTSQGNMATKVIETPVLVLPVVTYAATSAIQGPASLTVDFMDQTDTGNLTGITRRWTWGDGTTNDVAGANTSHTYTTAGCYAATLQLVTDQGTFSDNSMAIDIVVESAATFSPPTTGDNSQAGIMFDLLANRDLRVHAFTLDFTASGSANTVRLYTSAASSIGNETNAGAWTLAGDTAITSGTGVLVDTPDILMSASDRLGFYVLNTSAVGTGDLIRYGSAISDTSFTSTDIDLFTSSGKQLNGATDFDGSTFNFRYFVGTVHYSYEVVCAKSTGGFGLLTNVRKAAIGASVNGPEDGLYPSVEDEVPSALTPDGGRIVLSPYTVSASGSDGPVLVRTDHELNVLWERDLSSLAFDEIYDVQALPGGDILLSGATSLGDEPGEALLARLDEDGNFLWEQVLTGVSAASIRRIAGGKQGDVWVLAVEERDVGNVVPVVYGIDEYSNVLWATELPAAPYDHGWGISERVDGSIEILGSASDIVDDRSVWTYRLNPDGMARIDE